MERWQDIAISAVRHFRKRTAHWSLHDVEIDDLMQQSVAETLAVLRAHPDATNAYVVWVVARKLMSYVLNHVWDVPTVSLNAAHHVAVFNDDDDDETNELQQLIAKLARAGRVKGGARGQHAIAQTICVLEFLADGYSITRIAELMHLTPSAVRQIIARLRERLEAEYLQQEGEPYVTQRHCDCAFCRKRGSGT